MLLLEASGTVGEVRVLCIVGGMGDGEEGEREGK